MDYETIVTRDDCSLTCTNGKLFFSDASSSLGDAFIELSEQPLINGAAIGRWIPRRLTIENNGTTTQLLLVHEEILLQDEERKANNPTSLVLDWTVEGGVKKINQPHWTLSESALSACKAFPIVKYPTDRIGQIDYRWDHEGEISVDYCVGGVFNMVDECLALKSQRKTAKNENPDDPAVSVAKRMFEINRRQEKGCFHNANKPIRDPTQFHTQDLFQPISQSLHGVWSDSGKGDGTYDCFSKSLIVKVNEGEVKTVVVAVKIVFIEDFATETKDRVKEQTDKPLIPPVIQPVPYKPPYTKATKKEEETPSLKSENMIEVHMNTITGNKLGTLQCSLDDTVADLKTRFFIEKNFKKFPSLTPNVLGTLSFTNTKGEKAMANESKLNTTLRELGIDNGSSAIVLFHFSRENKVQEQSELRVALYGNM